MTQHRRFIQFPHPGGEQPPDRHGRLAWNTHSGYHGRRFMQLTGRWIESDYTPRSGKLWAWGEWEAESVTLQHLDRSGDMLLPAWLCQPYYAPKDDYCDLHNTDPFIFGPRFLYSNCKQQREAQERTEGLRHLGPGSLIVFGSGKLIDGERRWMLDTVLVVERFIDYTPATMRALVTRVPSSFMDVVGEPIMRNERADLPLRLYIGATPERQVNGMFSFFPAMAAGGDRGFARPLIHLPDPHHFNERNWRTPKGHAMSRADVSEVSLREMWGSLVEQVRAAGLCLGTYAALPRRRTR